MPLAEKIHTHKILKIASVDTSLCFLLSKKLGVPKIISQVLINRGITNPDEADKFLNTKIGQLLDPYSFLDMHKAVAIIRQSIEKKERIMVFGDYDADGITALAVMKDTLLKMGADAVHYIPHRVREGYGLNKNILNIVKEKNAKLLVTVDCGTNSHGEIRELRRHNIGVIITDHHQPQGNGLASSSQSHQPQGQGLPDADALINPKIPACGYKYRDLAGVGVAYKLCQALTGKPLTEELDLVSLGTIADVVPLLGENRIIAKEGLAQLSKSRRAGIRALMETSRLRSQKINARFVSYILGPRINASGRVDTADIALNLLLSKHDHEASELARCIEVHNRQRQKIESQIFQEAQALISKINFKDDKVIVIAREGWHHGVLGIVASKLADRFYRPTIVISLNDGLSKGSGRSIKNFHLFEALSECKEYLQDFGGHSHAVGLVIDRAKIEGFKEKINHLAKEKLHLEDLIPSLEIDMELSLLDLNSQDIEKLNTLEPFGCGNPEPLFFTRNLKLKSQPQVLSRDTLKFWVSDGAVTYPVIGFGMSDLADSLINADFLDLVYCPRIDEWQESSGIILEAKEIFCK